MARKFSRSFKIYVHRVDPAKDYVFTSYLKCSEEIGLGVKWLSKHLEYNKTQYVRLDEELYTLVLKKDVVCTLKPNYNTDEEVLKECSSFLEAIRFLGISKPTFYRHLNANKDKPFIIRDYFKREWICEALREVGELEGNLVKKDEEECETM